VVLAAPVVGNSEEGEALGIGGSQGQAAMPRRDSAARVSGFRQVQTEVMPAVRLGRVEGDSVPDGAERGTVVGGVDPLAQSGPDTPGRRAVGIESQGAVYGPDS